MYHGMGRFQAWVTARIPFVDSIWVTHLYYQFSVNFCLECSFVAFTDPLCFLFLGCSFFWMCSIMICNSVRHTHKSVVSQIDLKRKTLHASPIFCWLPCVPWTLNEQETENSFLHCSFFQSCGVYKGQWNGLWYELIQSTYAYFPAIPVSKFWPVNSRWAHGMGWLREVVTHGMTYR